MTQQGWGWQEERQQLKRKLEDSKQQLQGNEHMIRWLNTQVRPRDMRICMSPGTECPCAGSAKQ